MELASLRYGHLRVTKGATTLRWPRLQGGKTLDDALPLSSPHSMPGKTLRHWLQTYYVLEGGPVPARGAGVAQPESQ